MLRVISDEVLRYRGVWLQDKTFAVGSVVTHSGSLWLAKEPTDRRPGTDPSWKMIVKNGSFNDQRRSKLKTTLTPCGARPWSRSKWICVSRASAKTVSQRCWRLSGRIGPSKRRSSLQKLASGFASRCTEPTASEWGIEEAAACGDPSLGLPA